MQKSQTLENIQQFFEIVLQDKIDVLLEMKY